MKDNLDFIDSTVKDLQKTNLFRRLVDVETKGSNLLLNGKKLINLSSNDYLGIRRYPSMQQIQSSSRLISGNDSLFRILETDLAKHKSQESSLIFPTGYMANLGTISTLARKGDVIFSDELNHVSIIEACRLSGAKIEVYPHNETQILEKKISKERRRKFIVTEGIFSMDGDFANLKEISEISQKNGSILILDDAHGDFVFGPDGAGTPSHFGIEQKIDIYLSSLSKGLGAFGGYVASKNKITQFLINKSRPFIYTSALPNFLVKLALIKFKGNRENHRKKLFRNIRLMNSKLKSAGYETKSSHHIIPILIGNEKKTLEFGKFLLNNGIFAQPIRFPTVKMNSARIRISITALLNNNQIEKSVEVLEKAGKKFGVL